MSMKGGGVLLHVMLIKALVSCDKVKGPTGEVKGVLVP